MTLAQNQNPKFTRRTLPVFGFRVYQCADGSWTAQSLTQIRVMGMLKNFSYNKSARGDAIAAIKTAVTARVNVDSWEISD